MVNQSPSLLCVQRHVNEYLERNDDQGFNRFKDFDWANLKESVHKSNLTAVHIGAVETAMLVEDHIPGYGSEYTRIFMVHEGRTDEEAWACRQMLHFVFRWLSEEDRHAHTLELWLRHSGMRDEQALTDLMVMEGKKTYSAPHDDPTQLFTYTSLQEKATQMYYTCLMRNIDEPVLQSVLRRLAADEARHCHFFSQLVLDALRNANAQHIQQIKDALQHFSMPLSLMMENYIRKAIQMKRAAEGYDFRDAMEHFTRLINQATDTRTNSRGGAGSANLEDLMQFVQTIMPAPRGKRKTPVRILAPGS